MNVPQGILRREGNYFLLMGISQYAKLRRFAFLVAFQGPEMAAPLILKGFGKTEKDLAASYFSDKAHAGKEQRRYEKRVREDLERKKSGMVRLDVSDVEGKARLIASGYCLALVENGSEWYVKLCTKSGHEAFAAKFIFSQPAASSKVCPDCGAVVRLVTTQRVPGISVFTIDIGPARRVAA